MGQVKPKKSHQVAVCTASATCSLSTDIFNEATYRYLARDVVYFAGHARLLHQDEHESRRYARASIAFLAFYFESVARLIYHRVPKLYGHSTPCQRTDWPKPLRLLQDAHTLITGTPICAKMCIDGVKDLFMIRNKMIAHPAGRTAAGSTTAPETGERLEVRAPSAPAEYNKLRGFPIQVSQFTAHHAVALIAEVRDFLLEYRGAIEKYISDAETLAACDAKELNAFLDSN